MVDAKLRWVLACGAAAAVLAAALCAPVAAAAAAAPAPPPGKTDCNAIIYEVSDCLSFLTPGSNVSAPPASCCAGIRAVSKVNRWCLCEALLESRRMDVKINMSRADELPSACHVPVPVFSECKTALAPTPAADAPAVLKGGDETSGGVPLPSPSAPAESPVAGAEGPVSGAAAESPVFSGSAAESPVSGGDGAQPPTATAASAALPLSVRCGGAGLVAAILAVAMANFKL